MKHSVFTVLAAVTALTIATAARADGPVRHRQKDQAARIHQGVESGTLTKGETTALKHEQHDINQDRRQALADGKMTKPEARHLTHEQNRASHHIHRLKHNNKTAAPNVAQQ